MSLVIELQKLRHTAMLAEQEANDLLKGKSVRIDNPHYNGQPYGRSRPSLQGKVFKINSAFFERRDDIYLWLEGQHLSIPLSHVTILD